MTRAFEVVPPRLALAWALPGLALLAALVAVAFAARQEPKLWYTLPVLAASAALVGVSVQRRRVELADGVLRIVAGINTLSVPVASLDPSATRIVELREQRQLRPLFKTFGTALPGLQAGYFRSRDRRKCFALLTDKHRVLVLEETGGRRVLLSLERPQALADALRDAATPGPRAR